MHCDKTGVFTVNVGRVTFAPDSLSEFIEAHGTYLTIGVQLASRETQ